MGGAAFLCGTRIERGLKMRKKKPSKKVVYGVEKFRISKRKQHL